MVQSFFLTVSWYFLQILYNLLGNAIKFGKDGKVVDFSVSMQEGQNAVRFSIKDYGMGIPPLEKERIFEPFRQSSKNDHAKHGGTGLGLAITRQLVRVLGGGITVESDFGKYCEFIVLLPFEAVNQPEVQQGGLAALQAKKQAEQDLVDRYVSKAMKKGPAPVHTAMLDDLLANATFDDDNSSIMEESDALSLTSHSKLGSSDGSSRHDRVYSLALNDNDGTGRRKLVEAPPPESRAQRRPSSASSIQSESTYSEGLASSGTSVGTGTSIGTSVGKESDKSTNAVPTFETSEQNIHEEPSTPTPLFPTNSASSLGLNSTPASKAHSLVEDTLNSLGMKELSLIPPFADSETPVPPKPLFDAVAVTSPIATPKRAPQAPIPSLPAELELKQTAPTVMKVKTVQDLPVSKETNIAEPSVSLSHLDILIAEDNKINQKVLLRTLNRIGLQKVDIVENGQLAVDASAEKDYDMIFMDLQMPIMDGLEATSIISKRPKHPKIVFVTAHALDDFQAKAWEAGGDGFISKPFKLQLIKDLLIHFHKPE